MKKLFILMAILFIGFASCTKDSLRKDCNETEETSKDAVAIHSGNFQFVAKSSTGTATIYRKTSGAMMIGLEGMNLGSNAHFKIMAASSKEATGIKIFSVVGLNGAVFHNLPAGFDLSLYRYIVIQAEPSEEVVAVAELR